MPNNSSDVTYPYAGLFSSIKEFLFSEETNSLNLNWFLKGSVKPLKLRFLIKRYSIKKVNKIKKLQNNKHFFKKAYTYINERFFWRLI